MFNSGTLNDSQREMLANALSSKNCLSIFSTGIGMHQVVSSLVNIYSTPKALVLILNCDLENQDPYLDCVTSPSSIQRVTSQLTATEKQRAYLGGGVLAITTRILVVDLLAGRIPVHLVSGCLVLRADSILEVSNEAFVLKLYREKNKLGFIKCFSDVPNAFSSGFATLAKAMRFLLVDEVFLWPRFHSSVRSSLDASNPTVTEIRIAPSSAMNQIQLLLVELLQLCISEIKSSVPKEFSDQVHCLFEGDFDFSKLDSSIGEIERISEFVSTSNTKRIGFSQLISDLRRLRRFVVCLFSMDAVSMFAELEAFRVGSIIEGGGAPCSFLLLIEQWEFFYRLCKERADSTASDSLPPKCRELKKIVESTILEQENFSILVICANEKSKHLIQEGLSGQTSKLVKRKIASISSLHRSLLTGKSQPVTSRGGRENLQRRIRLLQKTTHAAEISSSPQVEQPAGIIAEPFEFDDSCALSADFFDGSFQLASNPMVLVETTEEYFLNSSVFLLQPRVIILFDQNLSVIRSIEVACSFGLRCDCVYLLMYQSTVEESTFLGTVRTEKQSFESLIEEKALLPRVNENSEEDIPEVVQFSPKIIVDMRDFRSPLAFCLYRKGVQIFPATLEIGDYILSPKICIERKSIGDLVSSLNSGRLLSQIQAMCITYERPILLLEFDTSKSSFHLQGNVSVLSSSDVSGKLALLAKSFPKVKFIWSPSLDFSASIFLALKDSFYRGQRESEPVITQAMDESLDRHTDSYSQMLLMTVPGVISANVFKLARGFSSISQVATAELSKLHEIVGDEQDSKKIYSFFHS